MASLKHKFEFVDDVAKTLVELRTFMPPPHLTLPNNQSFFLKT